MKQLAENFAQLCAAQFDFNKWLDIICDEQIYEIGRNTNFPLHPAHYWTHIATKQAVDFIGHVENFEADFQELLSYIGVEMVQTINTNVVELEGNARYNFFGYRYTDRMSVRSIQKINRLFEQDFDLFNYERLIRDK